MKRVLAVFLVLSALLVLSGPAFAALTVIGTATYDDGSGLGPQDYNLIWDDDNNGNSVVWFDYTHARTNWSNQLAWAAGLDTDGVVGTEGQLTIIWNPGISVTWDDAEWRLPSAGINPQVGYNQTTSEMGHLYYDEFGLPAGCCRSNSDLILPLPDGFSNLVASWYWSGTEYAASLDCAWGFNFYYGVQPNYDVHNTDGYGLALRSGQVVSGSIPTLSEWGQILLVVMLGVSALWMNRRRTMSV